jgi:hypothetical protein
LYFAHASRGLMVRIVNLRNLEAPPIVLQVDRERREMVGELQAGDS